MRKSSFSRKAKIQNGVFECSKNLDCSNPFVHSWVNSASQRLHCSLWDHQCACAFKRVIKKFQTYGSVSVKRWWCSEDQKFLPIHWFEGSVNGENFIKMFEDKVWPSVEHSASRKGYWFMQDWATAHTTNAVLSYLKDKFQGRVVNHKTEFRWHPKSPDFNLLDFNFWGVAEKEDCDKRPKSLNQRKLIVKICQGNSARDYVWGCW